MYPLDTILVSGLPIYTTLPGSQGSTNGAHPANPSENLNIQNQAEPATKGNEQSGRNTHSHVDHEKKEEAPKAYQDSWRNSEAIDAAVGYISCIIPSNRKYDKAAKHGFKKWQKNVDKIRVMDT
jgi:hypothetical protein